MSRIKGADRRTKDEDPGRRTQQSNVNKSQIPGLNLSLSKSLGVAIAGWLALEIVGFMLIAHAIGLFLALLLAIGTSLIGLADSRRLVDYLRSWALRRTKENKQGAWLDGALQALGSFLLILPGFASDFAGLALKSPSVRANIMRRLAAKTDDPRIIDLAPTEWRHLAPKRSRKRAAKPPAD